MCVWPGNPSTLTSFYELVFLAHFFASTRGFYCSLAIISLRIPWALGVAGKIRGKDRRRTRRLPVRPKMGPLHNGDIQPTWGREHCRAETIEATWSSGKALGLPSLYVASLLLARCASRGEFLAGLPAPENE